MAVERVLLANPRGFCAGVEMAVKALAWLVERFPPPIYCYHEIVHNSVVVDIFRAAGVIFIDDIELVPQGATLMLSAHGSSPDVVTSARARASVLINAVCPLVTKVHHEVATRARNGYQIIYAGHAGHDEAVGTTAVAPHAVELVETEEDVAQLVLDPRRPTALLAQTTLSVEEWTAIASAARGRDPALWMPARADLCFATTNRQAAVKALGRRCDAIVVIGSANSSNTSALARVARASCNGRVVTVDGPSELPPDLSGVVGVTAGASAPEDVVQAVIESLCPTGGVEFVEVTEEDEYFRLPPELRRHLSPEECAADRTVTASDALARMAQQVKDADRPDQDRVRAMSMEKW